MSGIQQSSAWYIWPVNMQLYQRYARSSTFNLYVCSYRMNEPNIAPTLKHRNVTVYTADQTGTTRDPYLAIVVGTPWSFVGVGSSVVEVTATPLTLTEPAGVADGDLLVACIASRTTATTAVTNTGWTAVDSQNNNNTLATAVGASLPARCSIRCALVRRPGVCRSGGHFRGAGPHRRLSRQCHHDAAGCHRRQSQRRPAITAVSVTGLTTTQDDDLIVAMAAGGQEAAWSAFSNVTTPLTASGATDTTTAPSTTAWIERADSITTTGADTSLGDLRCGQDGDGRDRQSDRDGFDRCRPCRHCRGVQDSCRRSTADAWNVNDKSRQRITLSASDKTATLASGVASAVRSSTRDVRLDIYGVVQVTAHYRWR